MGASTYLSRLVASQLKARAAHIPAGREKPPSTETTNISSPKASDVAHFDEIYREFFAFVWRSARRLGVEPASLDDVVQEVFVIAHRRLSSFEGRSSLRTWIFGITLRVARDHRRARARKPLDADSEPHLLCDASPGPSERLERTEAIQLLYRILGELCEEQREVFVMADLEQMPMSTIAATLDINENTGYGRLRAARRSFNESLARHRARDEWKL